MKIAISLILLIASLYLGLVNNTSLNHMYQSIADLCHIDLKQLGIGFVAISDYGHSVAGFVLTLSLFKSFQGRLFLTAGVLVAFFCAIELLQTLTATRQPGVADVLRSVAGIVLGVIILLVFRKAKVKSVQNSEKA